MSEIPSYSHLPSKFFHPAVAMHHAGPFLTPRGAISGRLTVRIVSALAVHAVVTASRCQATARQVMAITVRRSDFRGACHGRGAAAATSEADLGCCPSCEAVRWPLSVGWDDLCQRAGVTSVSGLG